MKRTGLAVIVLSLAMWGQTYYRLTQVNSAGHDRYTAVSGQLSGVITTYGCHHTAVNEHAVLAWRVNVGYGTQSYIVWDNDDPCRVLQIVYQ